MAHFAKLDENNKVVDAQVVADGAAATEEKGQAFLNRLYNTNDVWKQCSYNTREGIHYTQTPEGRTPSEDQSKAFRLNYPGLDWTYNESADAFYSPRPIINDQLCNSWTLDTSTGMWQPPLTFPEIEDATLVEWDESVYQLDNTQGWVTAVPDNILESE